MNLLRYDEAVNILALSGLQVVHPAEEGDAEDIEKHHSELVLVEQDEVCGYKLRILEHVGSNLRRTLKHTEE